MCDMRRAADHQKVVLISLELQVELLIRAVPDQNRLEPGMAVCALPSLSKSQMRSSLGLHPTSRSKLAGETSAHAAWHRQLLADRYYECPCRIYTDRFAAVAQSLQAEGARFHASRVSDGQVATGFAGDRSRELVRRVEINRRCIAVATGVQYR